MSSKKHDVDLYVEHVQNLRRKSNTERNKSKYTRKVKHKNKED